MRGKKEMKNKNSISCQRRPIYKLKHKLQNHYSVVSQANVLYAYFITK